MSHAIATTDVPKNPAIRRVWICGQLRIRGASLRALAKEEGVTHQAMSAALMAPNVHLEPVIAKALDMSAEALFPERFDAAGRRVTRTRPMKRIMESAPGNVETQGAG